MKPTAAAPTQALPGLQSLDLTGCSDLRDEDLVHVAALTGLKVGKEEERLLSSSR